MLAVGSSLTRQNVTDWSQPAAGSQFAPFLMYSRYSRCAPALASAAGQLTRTIPSLCGCVLILASGGQVTRSGSGGSFGAAGRLTLTRGIALGSRPMYTTSRASGSTAQVA